MNRRRFPLMRLIVPEYDGPVASDPDGKESARRLRNAEIQIARGARVNQELSIRLAAVYRRNVYVSGRLAPDVWIKGAQAATDRSDFTGRVHHGMPDRDFLLNGEYEGVGVSQPLAEALLERDDRERLNAEHRAEVLAGALLLKDEAVLRMLGR
jgi:hypothetical protein